MMLRGTILVAAFFVCNIVEGRDITRDNCLSSRQCTWWCRNSNKCFQFQYNKIDKLCLMMSAINHCLETDDNVENYIRSHSNSDTFIEKSKVSISDNKKPITFRSYVYFLFSLTIKS